ncbi:MAG: protein-L-isoaspartate(D-aspartate) O-methyltransferase [Dehalococcoidia bacterium]|jgi:protein-L-isoaspartate(D-aspartate) O-methyltransferase|nr:protein-L-isoaspartate(D-aspartate) O-methyltransferase [Dehalococcoidia bacterium]
MAKEEGNTDRFAAARNELLDSVLPSAGRFQRSDERVRAAMRRVPREEFVPPEVIGDAYRNIALPIGEGQTISQPLIVEQMTTALQTRPSDRVLEIGAGSGYQAAVLSLLVAEVITTERIPRLADEARARLRRLKYGNVRVMHALNELGWKKEAPYDGIIVTAGAPELPLQLLDQLMPGRNLVIPVGALGKQELLVVKKTASGHEIDNLGACAFVPLIGPEAWPPDSI